MLFEKIRADVDRKIFSKSWTKNFRRDRRLRLKKLSGTIDPLYDSCECDPLWNFPQPSGAITLLGK